MPKVTIKRQRRVVMAVTIFEQFNEELDVGDTEHEPFNVIQRKIDGLVDLLGITEEEAERIVLNYSEV